MPGAQQMGERPTAIEIDQIDISLTLAGHAHVDDIAGTQIDLRRTAPTLDDHLLIVVHQTVQGLAYNGPQAGLSLQPRQSADGGINPAHDDYLALRVSAGLE